MNSKKIEWQMSIVELSCGATKSPTLGDERFACFYCLKIRRMISPQWGECNK